MPSRRMTFVLFGGAVVVAALAYDLASSGETLGPTPPLAPLAPVPGNTTGSGAGLPSAEPTRAPGFSETARESGLVFSMEFLPGEQGENFKINLYDHGCGVAVADIDGDGDDDVYFLNQLGENGLFRNEGGGRFRNVSAEAGVAVGDRICVAAAFGDVDSDGDQDLYVTSTRGGNVFFLNDGSGRFKDATAAAGLTLIAHSESAAFFDHDLDGDLDLFVTNTARWTTDSKDAAARYFVGAATLFDLTKSPIEHNILYANDGRGHFTDVTAATGLAGPGWGGDLAILDYDEDGRPDLMVTNMFGASMLYHNGDDGRFTDVTASVLGRTSWGTIGVKAFDYDGDGRLDLMLADMHSDMWIPTLRQRPEFIDERRKYDGIEGPMLKLGRMSAAAVDDLYANMSVRKESVLFGNTLFRNLGGGKFEETSDKAGVETFFPWGIAAADFDMDGFNDVYLPSGMGYPWFYWPSALLMNKGDGTFENRCAREGIDPPPGGDFLDTFIGRVAAAKSSRSAAVADFDMDGRPDLVVNNFNGRAYLYRNQFPARSWTGLRLSGTKSNRDAVGAVVTVRAGGRRHVRLVEPASGYLAQSSKTLHFGLGDAKAIETCEIRWPTGKVQKVTDLKLGAVNAVVEPAN